MKLPREVKIRIRTDGKVEIETFGFVGESCTKLSEVFERALAPEGPDSDDRVVRDLKPEYYTYRSKLGKWMSKIAPHSGQFRLLVRPTGEVIAPDLVEPFLPIVREIGGYSGPSFAERIACPVEKPKLTSAKLPTTDHRAGDLRSLSTAELWRIHAAGLQQSIPDGLNQGASLLDVKIELGRRMLQRCALCGHRCDVDRTTGQTGFCELGYGFCVAAYSMLYNEGPFVGQPTFGMFLKGCSLRCCFCYRADDLHVLNHMESPPEKVASILDQAADAGAESWHFLGGNPDQSIVAVLEALRLVEHSLPVVWNSALYVSREGLELLRGVVDIWIPDFKFGNDRCAGIIAGISDYSATVRANLLLVGDEAYVVVRHMKYPGHEECCQAVVEAWVRDNLPGTQLHLLEYTSAASRLTG